MTSLEQNYRAAEAITQWSERKLVRNVDVLPNWLGRTDRFWYRRDGVDGPEWVIVDAKSGERGPAFDHATLAGALAAAVGRPVPATDLPIERVRIDPDTATVQFLAFGRGWCFDTRTATCKDTPASGRPDLLRSPDGTLAVYRRGFDLWVLDLASGKEHALTTDGAASYAYGAPPECRARPRPHMPPSPIPPDALWSPDGRRLVTIQTDERQVKKLPILEYVPVDGSLRPKAHEVRVAWPGDAALPEYRIISIEVATGRQVAARYPRIPAVRMNDTPIAANLVWWSNDNVTCWFVDVERGEKCARLIEFDTDTGRCREVFEESAETFLDLSYNVYAAGQLAVLPERNEVLWYSERSGYAHLYLHDLTTGAEKRAVTSGTWVVRDVLRVDAGRREVWIVATGRRTDRHPYFREVCRVGLDTAEVIALTPEDADHGVWRSNDFGLMAVAVTTGDDPLTVTGLSPSGNFFVDTFSRVDCAPISTIRDRDGGLVRELERAELNGMPDRFRWPEIIRTTAADGETTIYGVMVRPPEADAGRPLPVINVIYGGPQIDAAPRTSFNGVSASWLTELLSYAQLGFVAVMFDGRGTPGRSKAFHDESYGRVETASNVADHIAGIRELATRHSFLDLERVGITGFSGGGYATAGAMLRYPEFYKVGVAGSGNYDQRMFWASWGERFQGLLDGKNYDTQAHDHLADRLDGKLMLIHGLLDVGCHPAALFRLTEALSRANKDYDLLLAAQAAHQTTGYTTRRLWDYFVRHLARVEPPRDLKIVTGADLMYARIMRRHTESVALVAMATGIDAETPVASAGSELI